MSKYRLRVISLLAIGLVLVGVLGFQALPVNNVMADSKSVVGSWNAQVTVVNQNATFPGLYTFTSDGVVLTDETPSPLETSGHGAWVKTKSNEAAYSFVFLIGTADANVSWLKGTVNGTLTYNPKTDQWSGPFTIKVVDQDGNEVLSDTGKVDGTRISAYR